MNTERKAWTDERLDDLSSRMDRGFDRVDVDLREIRAEIGSLASRFDSLQRMLLVGFVTILASVLAGHF
jgi:phosphosulfolactate synthase (CoM biosynthesis protein A)